MVFCNAKLIRFIRMHSYIGVAPLPFRQPICYLLASRLEEQLKPGKPGNKAMCRVGLDQSKPIVPTLAPTVRCSLLGTADALLLQTSG